MQIKNISIGQYLTLEDSTQYDIFIDVAKVDPSEMNGNPQEEASHV